MSMLDDIKENGPGITAHAVDGKCMKCGECCGFFVPFTELELSIIKTYVKDHNIKPVDYRLTPKGFEAKCCFYDKKNKKCNIYPVRPYVCRDFMCDRKDWREIRNNVYDKTDGYNTTTTMKLGTFDELVYGDIDLFIRYVVFTIQQQLGYADDVQVATFLIKGHREDIVEKMEFTGKDGSKMSGKELLQILKKMGV